MIEFARYEISTFEKTSDEILNSLKWKNISKEIHQNIHHLTLPNELPSIVKSLALTLPKVEDFQEMYDWVEEMQFERLGIFTYSHEENTHAHNFDDDVPTDVKQQRADEIMELQSGISYELNQQKIGQVYKVLIDKAEGDYFIGRSEFDSPEVDNEVLIKKEDNVYCRIGDFVTVEITKADHYDLYGKLNG